jgi:uroporphyrinogen-III decarboxylase
VVFEAAALAKPQLDEMDCALLGLATGPLTLASHLAGVRIFTSVKKKEGICPRDSSLLPERSVPTSARFYAQMGCDVIAIVDPVASQIRPETFREFVTPNCQEAVAAIHDAGRTSTFFHLRGLHQGDRRRLPGWHPRLCHR